MIDLYLHEKGRDSFLGTRKNPLRSLKGARDRIRKIRQGSEHREPVTVHVAKGHYPLSEILRFKPMDSHVTYRGAEGAVIDGGTRISNWKIGEVHGKKAWVAYLPKVKNKHWDFRELFVNGERRPRARYPKFGIEGKANENFFRIGELRTQEDGSLKNLLEGDFIFKPKAGDIKNWQHLQEAEVVVLHTWVEDRLPNPQYNPKTGWMECSRQSIFRLTETINPAKTARYYIDNLFDELTEPGEWFLDRHDGKLYYLPKTGETPSNTTVMAPHLCQFIEIEGRAFNRDKQYGDLYGGEPVRSLNFEGLTFRHADWIQPSAQSLFHDNLETPQKPLASSPQGAINIPGSIRMMLAEDCSLIDCTIEHTGFTGIEVDAGCRKIEISGNRLYDIGAGGIRIHGGELDEAGWRRTGHCSICDNTIEKGGQVFISGTGILLGNTFENIVAHNKIHDFTYSGISVGWCWGYRESVSRDNMILCNHVSKIGQGVTSDIGMIYCLGVQPGTVIAGNHLHDLWGHAYGAYGIYLDEGSSHIVVEQNLVYDLAGPNFTHHFGRENIIRRNVFLSNQQCVASIGLYDEECSDTFSHNLMVSENGFIYRGGYGACPEDCFDSDTNWFVLKKGIKPYTENVEINGRSGNTWKQWKDKGLDIHSTVEYVPAEKVPVNQKSALEFIKKNKLSKIFGLENPMWVKAGPRPAKQRKALWQPLKRCCVNVNII